MIINNAADIGSALREARRAKNLSQEDLGRLVGVSRQWVIGAEQGAPTARLDLVLKALRFVDLLVDVVPDNSAVELQGLIEGLDD